MLNMEATTRIAPPEVIAKALAYFGPKGYNLMVKDQNESCIYFEGGGGRIDVTANVDKYGTTTVGIISTEWDYPVKKFFDELPQAKTKHPF